MSGDALPRVFLTPKAFDVIRSETAAAREGFETGGILLGQGDGRPDLYVMVAGSPGPKAVHEPPRFLRDLDHAKALAAQAWAELQAVWIGEWHTHPTAGLTPSDADLTSYQRHLQDADLNFDRFLSIIVATEEGATALAAWVVEQGQAVLAEVVVQPEEEDGND
jgi:integrative and conjugative element protein (TIGR02256 family)